MDNQELQKQKLAIRNEILVYSDKNQGLSFETVTREFFLNEIALYRLVSMIQAKTLRDMMGVIQDLEKDVEELKGEKSRIIH